MSTSTSILIRVQARGGKFLGPDIGYSYVTVRDVANGRLLASSAAIGDSGQLGAMLTANASNGVVFAAPVLPNWLTATTGTPSPTAGFLATFDLDAPALVEITAAGTPNGVANQHTTSVRMWVAPGMQLTTEPGLVLELAGLNVEILEPSSARPAAQGQPIAVTAWVTMMCGCKISDGSAWPTGEFVVTASLVSTNGIVSSGTLQIQKTKTGQEVPSVYVGSLPCPPSGTYQLIVSAVQASTSNAGGSALTVTL